MFNRAKLRRLERRVKALCTQADAFNLDAWRDHWRAGSGRAYSTPELERDNPGWLEIRQGRLAEIAALDDGGLL